MGSSREVAGQVPQNVNENLEAGATDQFPATPATPDLNTSYHFSDSTRRARAEDFYLLREIASHSMSTDSKRLVKPSRGDGRKLAKMLGLDGHHSSPASQSPPEQDEAPAPSTPTTDVGRSYPFSPQRLRSISRQITSSPLSTQTSSSSSSFRGFITGQGKTEQEKITTVTPNTPETVRRRRGFRPLSVITSALYPFDFDPASTMNNAPDGQEPLPTPTKGKGKEIDDTIVKEQADDTADETSDTSSESTPSPSKAGSILARTPLDSGVIREVPARISDTTTVGSELSTSTENDAANLTNERWFKTKNGWFKADFPNLSSLPQPDLNKHPAFQADAFDPTNNGPLLTTNWTTHQIRKWSANEYFKKRADWGIDEGAIFDRLDKDQQIKLLTSTGRADRMVDKLSDEDQLNILRSQIEIGTSTPSTAKDSIGRRKKAFMPTKKSSENEEANIFDILAEGSPAASNRKIPQTPYKLSVDTSAPSVDLRVATNTSTPVTDDSERRTKSSSGLRSFSELFKARSGSSDKFNDKASTSSSPFEHPIATPELKRYDLERYLRVVTNCPSIEYSPISLHPRHPATSRDWKSRNLKCTNCLSSCCAICRRACCAYRAAVLGLENNKDNPTGRDDAMRKVVDITTVFPYGKEAPTFIQCTSCKELICPDCCGICPQETCGDTQCRRCKTDPWTECGWHNEGMEMCQRVKNSDSGDLAGAC